MTGRERGTTTVAGRVVRKVAEQAAREAVTGTGGSVTRGAASVRGGSADVSVDIALAYRGTAALAAQAVRDHVAARTSHLTGLRLPAPRIMVREVSPTVGVPAPAFDTSGPAPGGVRRRKWSERRLPVGVLAAAAFFGAGALLQEAVAAHVLGRPPALWRSRLVDWLSSHGPTSTPVWAGAALAGAGLWMVVLALVPGRRGDLVMSTPGRGVRGVISRRSARRLVRAALADVPGISRVRVRVGRRRLTVRAELVSGDKARAREQAAAAVAGAVREMSLAAPLRIRVRVRVRVRVRPSSRRQPALPPRTEVDTDGPHA